MEASLSTFRELFVSDDEGDSDGMLTPTSPPSDAGSPMHSGDGTFNLDFGSAKDSIMDGLATFREAASPTREGDFTPEFAAAVRDAATSLFGADSEDSEEVQ